jgi:hypothetical protein
MRFRMSAGMSFRIESTPTSAVESGASAPSSRAFLIARQNFRTSAALCSKVLPGGSETKPGCAAAAPMSFDAQDGGVVCSRSRKANAWSRSRKERPRPRRNSVLPSALGPKITPTRAIGQPPTPVIASS